MNNFEKEAQQRSMTKAVGRAINPMEWMRQLSSQKYRSLIKEVDRVDAHMRKRVLELKPSLRDQLHQARMAMKNHEYLLVFQYATSILNSVDGVFVEKMGDLDALGRRVYEDFAKDRMSEEERRQLEEDLFREPIREKASNVQRELVIEAGITQWLQEKLPTKRELEGNLFNKIFQNVKGKQQEAARDALNVAERSYDLITEAFKRLDDERRNIFEYIKIAREYHKNLSLEKLKLRKLYSNYFPIKEQEDTVIEAPQAPEAPMIAAPPAQAPVAQPVAAIPAIATPPEPTAPVTTTEPEDPNKKKANDLIQRAKRAVLAGDVGVGIALLVKASEICDEYGDEQISIVLLKAAANLNRVREQTARKLNNGKG
ncbi:hypothetical protein M0R72_02120 [Candidatus Pacearchaeota archaeon]|jgi:hypothetical protein|nr:hypothetical protein [Candidatus Pacearchaeota archaeon]